MFTHLLFLQNIGMTELLIILAIVLLLFGATKLPSLARSLGSSVNEFKKGMKDGKDETPADAAKKDETASTSDKK